MDSRSSRRTRWRRKQRIARGRLDTVKEDQIAKIRIERQEPTFRLSRQGENPSIVDSGAVTGDRQDAETGGPQPFDDWQWEILIGQMEARHAAASGD
jgi:hypothetical protein